MAKNRTTPNYTQKLNFWAFANNVTIKAMGKGLFVPLCFFAILMTVILRLPSDDVSNLVKDVLSIAKLRYYLGYLAAVTLGIGWWRNTRLIRVRNAQEIERISNERNFYQEKALGVSKLPSSNR